MTHHPHILLEQLEREKFTGSVEFSFEVGRLIRVRKIETVEVGPRKAVWPAVAQTKDSDDAQADYQR
jgi:hypothetical protein